VVDGVFNGQIADPTGGATHFFNPKEVDQTPPWAADGTNVRPIGNHVFMTVPLTMNSTGGTILPTYRPPGHDEEASVNEADGPGGYDVLHTNPEFLARIGKLRDDAAAQGIRTRVLSGYRDTKKQELLYENYQARLAGRPIPHPELGPGNVAAPPGGSFHNYGIAMDVEAIDANGNRDPVGQQKLIALADQPGRGLTAGAHFKKTPDYDHFQASEGRNAPLASIAAGYTGPSMLEMAQGGRSTGVTVAAAPAATPAATGAYPPSFGTDAPASTPNPLAKVNTAGVDTQLGGGTTTRPPAGVPAYAGGTTAASPQNPPTGAPASPQSNPAFPLLKFGGVGAPGVAQPQYVSAMNLADALYGKSPTPAPATPTTPAQPPIATTLPPDVVAKPPLPPVNPFRPSLASAPMPPSWPFGYPRTT
jgi:hypothetical protein